jgi:hypothetical protein
MRSLLAKGGPHAQALFAACGLSTLSVLIAPSVVIAAPAPQAAAQPAPQHAAPRPGALQASAVTPEPATWIRHNVIVPLDHLPKRYSCDDLWYKFRDVLLAVGARADYQILPYRCEKSLGARGRSPQVQLTFWLPEALTGAQQKWADLSVVRKSVDLQPGQPSTLDASDCELLRQIKTELLPTIPVKVTSYRLACEKLRTRQPQFQLSLAALLPAGRPSNRLANERAGQDAAHAE